MRGKPSSRRDHGSGSIRPKGRRWEGRARIEGRQASFSLGLRKEIDPVKGITRTQAEKALREAISAYKPGITEGIPTFSEVGAAYFRERELLGRRAVTVREYRSYHRLYFEPAFGDRLITRISEEEIRRLQQKLLTQASTASVRIWMTVLHGIFGSAVPKYLPHNPVAQIEKPKAEEGGEIRFLELDQFAELMAQIPEDDYGEIERTLYPIGAMTGLRRGELVGVRNRHIDWLVRKLRVQISTVHGKDQTPKSKKGRTVPLTDAAMRLLDAHAKATDFTRPDDRVFTITGNSLDPGKLTKRFRAAIVRGNIGEFRPVEKKGEIVMEPVLTFHSLRHTYGVAMARNPKVALVELQQWMGHKDIKTTMRYATFQPGTAAAERAEESFADFPTNFPQSGPNSPQLEQADAS